MKTGGKKGLLGETNPGKLFFLFRKFVSGGGRGGTKTTLFLPNGVL
jgi:hypothetical protein